MQTKVLAIVPNSSLGNTMQSVAENWPDIELHILLGNLSEGAQIARDVGDKYDIIISRGGTADMIRRCCDAPVVEMGVSSYDMLRTIMLAQFNGGKFAIVGFPFISSSARMVRDLFQYQIDIFPINTAGEIGTCLKTLKSEGYSLIIGDVITCDMAASLDLNSILITSGIETIEAAFRRAVELTDIRRVSEEKAAVLEKLLDNTDQMIFAFTKERALVFSGGESPFRATMLTQLQQTEALWHLPENEGSLQEICDMQWLLRRITISVNSSLYTAFFIRQFPMIPVGAQRGITVITDNEPEHIITENYMEHSRYMQPILELARKFSKFHYPVVMIGERGVGKDTLAFIMKRHAKNKFTATVMIDCVLVPEDSWFSLLNDQNSIFFQPKVMFYYRNFELLSPMLKDKIIKHISRSRSHGKSFHIIAINSDSTVSEANCLLPSALDTLQCNTLFIPSLRARQGDIPHLVALYFSHLNNRMGTQAVRIEPRAINLLQSFPWPGNLYQFKRIMIELLSISDGPVIGEAAVYTALQQEVSSMVISHSSTMINISGSLEDIEKRIIHYVLKEEDMNQTKAAARLGISRATLWRKLKSGDIGTHPSERRPSQ